MIKGIVDLSFHRKTKSENEIRVLLLPCYLMKYNYSLQLQA